MTAPNRKIVIIGGGMMGCSTAYHLSQLGQPCTLIERTAIACAASGKAGGFLARSWCDGSASGPLARASFELHKLYGSQFNCDYRAVETLEAKVDVNSSRKKRLSSAPDWLNQASVVEAKIIADAHQTAQVHPGKLCQSFIESAEKEGCEVIYDEVVGIELAIEDASVIRGVRLSKGQVIACDTVVLAMGPWTNVASEWFDYHLPQIGAERAHSIVVTPKGPISASAVFLDYKNDNDEVLNIEVYPRPDGTVYVCGYNDKMPLPRQANLVTPNEESLQGLRNICTHVSSCLDGCELKTGQACYLPLPPKSDPVIGEIPFYKGRLFMAAGHYCWGILNGPATGKGLAELIVKGRSSIDLSPFDPSNFL